MHRFVGWLFASVFLAAASVIGQPAPTMPLAEESLIPAVVLAQPPYVAVPLPAGMAASRARATVIQVLSSSAWSVTATNATTVVATVAERGWVSTVYVQVDGGAVKFFHETTHNGQPAVYQRWLDKLSQFVKVQFDREPAAPTVGRAGSNQGAIPADLLAAGPYATIPLSPETKPGTVFQSLLQVFSQGRWQIRRSTQSLFIAEWSEGKWVSSAFVQIEPGTLTVYHRASRDGKTKEQDGWVKKACTAIRAKVGAPTPPPL
jgi:hypothetical protein